MFYFTLIEHLARTRNSGGPIGSVEDKVAQRKGQRDLLLDARSQVSHPPQHIARADAKRHADQEPTCQQHIFFVVHSKSILHTEGKMHHSFVLGFDKT